MLIVMDIHVQWQGPFSLTEVKKLTNQRFDFGLYQIYAHHPVYGRCLVYIGLAALQTFGIRIPAHRWDSGSENDPDKIEVYVGRLKGAESPSDDDQVRQIRLAEALLIHSHAPAYNTQHAIASPKGHTHGDIRVLNWGSVRSLHREVSGLMWSEAGAQFQTYKAFERLHEKSEKTNAIDEREQTGLVAEAVETFYSSANGDQWQLVTAPETGRMIVRHEPNPSSGGQTSEIAVPEFLIRSDASPQAVALRALLEAREVGDRDGDLPQ